MNRVGIRVSSSAQRIALADNSIDGFAVAVDDQQVKA
jgi:hypothetical protein